MDTYNCPWIATVVVLSKKEDEEGKSTHEVAKCVLDTGNLQGNLVSKSLLIQHFGYDESDIEPLENSDMIGLSVSGHLVEPVGAVKLSWYHQSSPRVYRDMEFLVTEDSIYELVLCAQDIENHKLLSPPNFSSSNRNNMVGFNLPTSKNQHICHPACDVNNVL